jgi:uncharacterized protein
MLSLGSITDTRDLEQLLRALRPLLSRHKVRVSLFGSRARGDARRASDIDLALIGETPLPLDELARARQSLEESNIPFRVDLLDYATVSPSLRRSIDREGIEWTV